MRVFLLGKEAPLGLGDYFSEAVDSLKTLTEELGYFSEILKDYENFP